MSDLKSKVILPFPATQGVIEIRPHPEDVIEVEPHILAGMEARLQGKSFAQLFGDEDKVSNEFLLRQEVAKLKRVFDSANEVGQRFSSIRSTKELNDELTFEELDKAFLGNYALKKTNGLFVDECDLYQALLETRYELVSKGQKLEQEKGKLESESEVWFLLNALKAQYLSSNLSPLQITKEVIQLEPLVAKLIKEERAAVVMNELLAKFYGER